MVVCTLLPFVRANAIFSKLFKQKKFTQESFFFLLALCPGLNFPSFCSELWIMAPLTQLHTHLAEEQVGNLEVMVPE